MKHLVTILSAVLLPSLLAAQGGQGGFGGGFGGGAGGQGGMQQQIYDRTMQNISNLIAGYLDSDPIQNILTPEGFSEWTLTMKAGQVVIAEATSEAFDPMLEVFDGSSVVATNDDRFAGDQRPLLMWRCEKDGAYFLRARSFRDKAGGQFLIGYKVYDSVDLTNVESADIDSNGEFLVRIHLKKGEVGQVHEMAEHDRFPSLRFREVISPIGLPVFKYDANIDMLAPDSVVGQVEGDYYVVASGNKGKYRVGVRKLPILKLDRVNGVAAGFAEPTVPTLWSVDVKAGEILEFVSADISSSSPFIVTIKPDFSKFDLAAPESNPFFPSTVPASASKPQFAELPGKARDNRRKVVAVLEDTTLWIGVRGLGATQPFSVTVRPGAHNLTESRTNRPLRIGMYDYWVYDAKVGDVMDFKVKSSGFAPRVVARDPSLLQLLDQNLGDDQTPLTWSFIAERAGQYLVAVSCLGDGGGGEYTMERKSYAPRVFAKDRPATGKLEGESVHVWKVTVEPEVPLLMHWKSSNHQFSYEVRGEDGSRMTLPLTAVDSSNRYAILKVAKRTTYVIILRSAGVSVDYSINLLDLPGSSK